jgi:hypothetical protein
MWVPMEASLCQPQVPGMPVSGLRGLPLEKTLVLSCFPQQGELGTAGSHWFLWPCCPAQGLQGVGDMWVREVSLPKNTCLLLPVGHSPGQLPPRVDRAASSPGSSTSGQAA